VSKVRELVPKETLVPDRCDGEAYQVACSASTCSLSRREAGEEYLSDFRFGEHSRMA
jgi:hypothetical protein